MAYVGNKGLDQPAQKYMLIRDMLYNAENIWSDREVPEQTRDASRKNTYIILHPPPLPRKPHFYIVKLGFTGVYIIFLIFAQKHRLWVLVRTASLRQF